MSLYSVFLGPHLASWRAPNAEMCQIYKKCPLHKLLDSFTYTIVYCWNIVRLLILIMFCFRCVRYFVMVYTTLKYISTGYLWHPFTNQLMTSRDWWHDVAGTEFLFRLYAFDFCIMYISVQRVWTHHVQRDYETPLNSSQFLRSLEGSKSLSFHRWPPKLSKKQAEASAYRSRAKDSAGWPLIVTEMGVVTEPSKSIGTWNQEANGFGLASFWDIHEG